MAFRLSQQKAQKQRQNVERKRTAEALAAFEASFDAGPTKAFVRAAGPGEGDRGATYAPPPFAAPPKAPMPHRARRAGAKSSMDEFLDELKKRETLRSFGADVDGPAPPRSAPPA
ncbi:hypothetical protein JL721_4376 [Aureococcus anophagefferens]|nr:hypothetical protein JL721_4376 [Aureococcus anophagefferens]